MENAGEPKPEENGETKMDQPKTTGSAKSPKPSSFVDDQLPKSPFSQQTEVLDRDTKSCNSLAVDSSVDLDTTALACPSNLTSSTTQPPSSPSASLASSTALGSPPSSQELPKEPVNFVVIHNKNKYDVEFPLDDTVAKLKLHLHNLIGVPETLQKVMFRGLAKDDKTLREIGVTAGAKVMVVGSKLDEVLAVSTPSSQAMAEDKAQSASSKEPLCKQKLHKKVLDKGVPDDVMPGILNAKEPLPPYPLSGMLNKTGGKVRLTFKLELDQLWIGTKERTDKITMATIKSIVSEPIEGHEEYHVMGIQLGTTEASRYWVYWVPAQYVESIKEAVLGTWVS